MHQKKEGWKRREVEWWSVGMYTRVCFGSSYFFYEWKNRGKIGYETPRYSRWKEKKASRPFRRSRASEERVEVYARVDFCLGYLASLVKKRDNAALYFQVSFV